MLKAKREKTYIVLWEDKFGNYHQDYIKAYTAVSAVEYLELSDIQVIEVAVVLKNWKGSK